MLKVPSMDLKAPHQGQQKEIAAALSRVVESGWYILGPEVEAFESEFANYCEAKYCVGVGTGLDALHLILRAMEIGAGDEVIVPANTYIATWLAKTYGLQYVGYYLSASAVLTFLGLLMIRETKDEDLARASV